MRFVTLYPRQCENPVPQLAFGGRKFGRSHSAVTTSPDVTLITRYTLAQSMTATDAGAGAVIGRCSSILSQVRVLK